MSDAHVDKKATREDHKDFKGGLQETFYIVKEFVCVPDIKNYT